MSDTTPLTVYIKPGCPWCVDAIAYLKRAEFQFDEVDVISNPAEFKIMQELSGQSCAPTLTYGELMLADFDVDEMCEFFNEHGIQP